MFLYKKCSELKALSLEYRINILQDPRQERPCDYKECERKYASILLVLAITLLHVDWFSNVLLRI